MWEKVSNQIEDFYEEDSQDFVSKDISENREYLKDFANETIEGLLFGVIKRLLANPICKLNIEKIVSIGDIVIEFEPIEMNFDEFNYLLSADYEG